MIAAHYHAARHEARFQYNAFHSFRLYVLAARDDEVVLAPENTESPRLVEVPEIATSIPTLGIAKVDDRAILPIAQRKTRTAQENLACFGDVYLMPLEHMTGGR